MWLLYVISERVLEILIFIKMIFLLEFLAGVIPGKGAVVHLGKRGG